MLTFDLVPRSDDPSWGRGWQPRDPATRRVIELRDLPGSAFTFEYFQVNVVLIVGGVDFSLKKMGIPVLDFVLLLDSAMKDVNSSGVGRGETSISQDVFQFISKGDLVEMSASFSGDVAIVSLGELEEVVVESFKKATNLLYAAHQELVDNRYLTSLSRHFRGRFSV